MSMADEDRGGGAAAAAFHHPSSTPPTTWATHPGTHMYSHSHHGTPAQDYNTYAFATSPTQMDSSPYLRMNGGAGGTVMSSHNPHPSHSHHQRSQMHQLQPLVMPHWPSELNTQSSHPNAYATMQHPAMAQLQTPVSASSNTPITSMMKSPSTSRKTLTDDDRKRMCEYAEAHPEAKQQAIGAMFGVERSTVSKVLRQKEKYLRHNEGGQSPIKRVKGRSPDIERALSVWAVNQEKRGVPLTDELIRDKARAFAATTSPPENHKPLSSSWLEKFKLKNNLMGARSRRASLANDESDAASISASRSRRVTSTTSPISPTLSPPPDGELRTVRSLDSVKDESPESYVGGFPNAFHTQGLPSTNTSFTDGIPLSPPSPFFTPDSGTAPSPYLPSTTAGRQILPAGAAADNTQRQRSQTFPLLDHFVAGPTTSGSKYGVDSGLDSSMEDASGQSANALGLINEALDHSSANNRSAVQHEPNNREVEGCGSQTISPNETMRPPPLPAHLFEAQQQQQRRMSLPNTSVGSPTSAEEARRALTIVMAFFEQQPDGYLNFNETYTMGQLMQKLKLQSRTPG